MAIVHIGHLDIENFPDPSGFKSIDSQLDRFPKKRVVDFMQFLFQAEKPVLAGFLRECVYDLDELLRIEFLFKQNDLEKLRKICNLAEGRGNDRCAESTENDQNHSRDLNEGGEVPPLHDKRNKDGTNSQD